MKVQYTIFNPTGNITALVKTQISRKRYKEVASLIMGKHPEVEQVGFIESPKGNEATRLYMAGGEFCGNATLCACAQYMTDNDLDNAIMGINVSGAGRLDVSMIKESGVFKGIADMPKPSNFDIYLYDMPDGSVITVPVVAFAGIVHGIMTEFTPEALGVDTIREICKKGCEEFFSPCFGLMCYDALHSILEPYVYVADVQSFFRENSCASGSAALTAHFAKEKGYARLKIKQPGGVLTCSASKSKITLTGEVRRVGEAEIEIG